MTTLSTYLDISKNLTKYQAMTAKEGDVATATKYFQANIGSVKSAAALVANPRLFNYAMTAFGLGDRTYAKSLMTKVLQQGTTSSKALANTLNDPNILAFAKAFNFATKGAATTSSTTLVKNVVDRYTENALEKDQGKQNPGVQLALYFQRNAPNLTSSYGILADKTILKVVQTALDVSPMMAYQPIDTQKAMLDRLVKVADFKDPAKLQKFITKFTAMYDVKNSSSTGVDYTNALTLDASQSNSFGFGSSLMQALQSYKAW